MLNPDSPLPLYHQLAELLATRIREGRYAPGTKIPSEPELARTYRIGRPTVREATELLVGRRLIQRRRGAGTFVCESPPEVDVFTLAGTFASFKAQGIELKTSILVRLRRRKVDTDSDNPMSEREAYSFWRLSKVKNEPVLLECLWLDPAVFPDLEQVNLMGRPLSSIVEEHYHMKPESGRQTFRVTHGKGKVASALEVSPRTPLLLIKRSLSFPGAPEALYSELYCRTDQVVYSQSIGDSPRG